jgi:hypothetical protein
VPIREFFHLMHIVADIEAADAWYDAMFSPQRYVTRSWSDLDKRFASLAKIGDFTIETMEPSAAPEDAGAPLPKFRARFGEHLHSLAWFVDADDLQTLFDQLRARGVRIAQPGGGLFPDGPVEVPRTIFTHPKDTFGQLEFQMFDELGRAGDPRFAGGWSSAWWRDEQPLGVVRVSHFTTIVRDLDRARGLYLDAFGARVLDEVRTDSAESVFVFVPTETVVELARPTDDNSLLGRDLAANGELPHAATFTVRDLEQAERHVEKVGTRILERRADGFTLDPADCFGAVYSFTEATVAGDPRVGST